MELVDMLDLGSNDANRVGSSPTIHIVFFIHLYSFFIYSLFIFYLFFIHSLFILYIGWMAEWSKASVLKTEVMNLTASSNLASPV